MATHVTSSPEAIARDFAAAIHDQPGVDQLWLVENRGSVVFIVMMNASDAETERRISDVFGDLVERYPSVSAHLRLSGPDFFVEGTDVVSLMALYARQIPLRPELEPQGNDHVTTPSLAASPEMIAREFVAAIRDVPAVEQLWLVVDRASMQLIAITSDVDRDTELRIFDVFCDLIARHPVAGIFPRVLNPRFFVEGTDIESLLPQRARQIPLCD